MARRRREVYDPGQIALIAPPETRQELDHRLQGLTARAAHWQDPPPKVRTGGTGPATYDYRAWLEHAEDCATCQRARADLRFEEWDDDDEEPEITVACPEGLRMMPWEELGKAVGPRQWDRMDAALLLARLVDHARRMHGRHEAGTQHLDVGVGWRRMSADAADG